MKSLYSLNTSFLLAFFSFAFSAAQQAPITGEVPFAFRDATLDDIDDITTVHLDAFKSAPAWKYITQFADIYPNYTWNCDREMFKQLYLNNSEVGNVAAKVISVPDQSSHRKERVVSISIWELDPLHQAADKYFILSASLAGLKAPVLSTHRHSTDPAELGYDCDARLDTNMTRAEHFRKALGEAQETYLTKPYGPQFFLSLLATHPDWDGNGLASRHIRWGKETLAEWNRASKHRLPLTLIGTPAGYPLYISEGFEGLHNITIERLDGQGVLWYEAMKYDEE